MEHIFQLQWNLAPLVDCPPFIFILFFSLAFSQLNNENQGFSKVKWKSKLSLQLSHPSTVTSFSLTLTVEISIYWFLLPSLSLCQGLTRLSFLIHDASFNIQCHSPLLSRALSIPFMWLTEIFLHNQTHFSWLFPVSSILSSFPIWTKELSFTHSSKLEIIGPFKKCFLLYICASQVVQW